MDVRNRMYELTTEEELDSFLTEHSTCVLFKAGGCHKTMQGFGHVEAALAPRAQLHLGFVRVIQSRPVSNKIADLTGIQHESPQFILIIEGKPVFDVDNWEITPEILDHALMLHFGPLEGKGHSPSEFTVNLAGIAPYIELLHDYLTDEISEQSFSTQWLTTFQNDDELRSKEECRLLNSLFGDVDLALQSGSYLEEGETPLRARAKALLEQLQSH